MSFAEWVLWRISPQVLGVFFGTIIATFFVWLPTAYVIQYIAYSSATFLILGLMGYFAQKWRQAYITKKYRKL